MGYYGISTTSTWLVPVACKLFFTIYMTCAIHWKLCPAAFFVGLAFEAGILAKPKPFHLDYAKPRVAKGISLSVFGPLIRFDEYSASNMMDELSAEPLPRIMGAEAEAKPNSV